MTTEQDEPEDNHREKRRRRWPYVVLGIFVLFVALAASGAWRYATQGSKPNDGQYEACKAAVLDRTQSPQEAKFRDTPMSVSSDQELGGTILKSWVEAPNVLGQMARAVFSCQIGDDGAVMAVARG